MNNPRPDTAVLLDIDGVVSPLPHQEPEYHYSFPAPFVWAQPMVPVRLRVAEWLSRVPARLVWSSSWGEPESLTRSLGAGPQEAVDTSQGKGAGVAAWIAANPEVTRVLVADDDHYDIEVPPETVQAHPDFELVRLRPDRYHGLSDADLETIERFARGGRP